MRRIILIVVILAIVALVLYSTGLLPLGKPKPAISPQTPVTPITTPKPSEEPTSDGITLFEQGKYQEALKQLEKEVAKQKTEDVARHLSYIALAYERLGKSREAVVTWQKIINEHSQSPVCGNAYYALGKMEPDKEKRIASFEKAVAHYPTSAGAKSACLELGETYLASNLPDKEFKARHCFSLALKSELPKENIKQLKQRLTELNKKLVFSNFPTPDSVIYVVKPGDTLTSISNKHKVEPGGEIALGHIPRINQLKTDRIYPDDKFKIITGKFHIELNKTEKVLTLYLNNDFVKEYPIAIGRPGNDTPTGMFYITGKVAQPPWHKRSDDGRLEIIPYGDPRNILGTRWLGFKDTPRLGIHGTTQPETIGKKITDGCVRMLNEDVEELYDLVPEGTEVFIIE